MRHTESEFQGRWWIVWITLIVAYFTICYLLVGCGYAPTPEQPEMPTSAIDDRNSATVSIEVHGCLTETGMQFGTGVILDEHHVLTATHVVLCAGPVTITTTTGAEFEVEHEIVALDIDVTRLRTSAALPHVPPPELGSGKEGQLVCMVAAMPERNASCGSVREITIGTIDHTATTIPGNSGAPLYDSEGRLLGIVVTRFTDRDGGRATALATYSWLVTSP